jgi:beta-mannosidase
LYFNMPRRALDLSTLSWQMGQAQRQPFTAQPVDDRARVHEWLPARVPGDVRADLIAAGRIPPVDTPEGIAAGEWVDHSDWWYRAALSEGYGRDDVLVLEADGIDYYSALWLDDRLLATHAGMFSRQSVILPSDMAPGQPQKLAIRLWGAGALPRLANPPWRRAIRSLIKRASPGVEYFPDRMATPKAQFGFGWDFSPRLLSAGIWDDTRLIACRGAYIEDVQVRAEPLTDADPTPVRWRIRLSVQHFEEQALTAEVTVAEYMERASASAAEAERTSSACAPQSRTPFASRHALPAGIGPATHDITFDSPPLPRWWPWDQGEPRLCRVNVRLTSRRGVADEIEVLTGVRTVVRQPLADGSPWRFVINGRPVFIRGANWTPADVLPGRVTADDYARLLGMARAAGINFLRVWGGGVREKAAFWAECDRLGLMAWQEFPLACAFLDHYPRTGGYLAALGAEARGIVQLLRNHPSLVAWCGGNEINAVREVAPLGVLSAAIEAEDGTRPWIASSPSGGDVHQWDVWHGYAPWAGLQDEAPPFMSEFGMQALPDERTLAAMFAGSLPAGLVDPRWAGRKAQVAKLRFYNGGAGDRDLMGAIADTQRVQAAALQAGIEACRLRRETLSADPRGPVAPALLVPDRAPGSVGSAKLSTTGPQPNRPCGGVAFWQFNEPWYAVSWAVVDRAGRPKAAYETVKHSYAPVLIAARFPRRDYRAGCMFVAEIWCANDTALQRESCRTEAWLDGRCVWQRAGITVQPLSATRLGSLAVRLRAAACRAARHAAAPMELILRLLDANGELAINRYDLAVPLPAPRPLSGRLIRWLADRLLGS